jgi:hypothetical protein
MKIGVSILYKYINDLVLHPLSNYSIFGYPYNRRFFRIFFAENFWSLPFSENPAFQPGTKRERQGKSRLCWATSFLSKIYIAFHRLINSLAEYVKIERKTICVGQGDCIGQWAIAERFSGIKNVFTPASWLPGAPSSLLKILHTRKYAQATGSKK